MYKLVMTQIYIKHQTQQRERKEKNENSNDNINKSVRNMTGWGEGGLNINKRGTDMYKIITLIIDIVGRKVKKKTLYRQTQKLH